MEGETKTYKSCGCRIFRGEKGKYDIDYCPLHKHAPKLHEALGNSTKVLGFLKEKTPFPDKSVGGMQINNALFLNEQALSLAEKGE